MRWRYAILGGTAAAAAATTVHDLVQTKHAIIRNFPVVGHARYFLERFGPELRQYIVTSNDEERPFSRDQRRWVYASSKLENNYFGFGTDNDIEQVEGYPIIKHRTFTGPGAATMPHAQEEIVLPCAKVMGAARGRPHAFRPGSVVNISGMSFGSLSGKAIESLNKGAALAGCLQNTGEGALSPHHRHGGDVVFQIGTSYFGCRDEHGKFDMGRLVDLVQSAPVRAIEIKLSQGAKPGLGGMLPGEKVSKEIAEIRGIPEGEDCASPSRHAVFSDVDSMLDFVEGVAQGTGLPVGIKSAVGNLTGTTPAGIPEWTVVVGAQYEQRVGAGLLIPRVSYLYASETQVVEGLPGFLVRNPDGSIANAAPAIAAAAPFTVERNDLTASLGYEMDMGLTLEVWGRNLLKDENIEMIFDSVAQPRGISGYINDPRTYGITARFKW